MPEASLTPQERTLQVFCRIFAVVYTLGGLGFALTPRLTFRLITLDRAPAAWDAQAAFWNVLACAMMTAIATACGVVSGRPRERRHALLPVVVAKITSSGLAAMHLARMGGSGSMALIVVIATDFPLFIVTL